MPQHRRRAYPSGRRAWCWPREMPTSGCRPTTNRSNWKARGPTCRARWTLPRSPAAAAKSTTSRYREPQGSPGGSTARSTSRCSTRSRRPRISMASRPSLNGPIPTARRPVSSPTTPTLRPTLPPISALCASTSAGQRRRRCMCSCWPTLRPSSGRLSPGRTRRPTARLRLSSRKARSTPTYRKASLPRHQPASLPPSCLLYTSPLRRRGDQRRL